MRLVASTPVAAPQGAVFAQLLRIDAHPDVFRRIVAAAQITSGSPVVGTEFTQTVQVKGARYDLRQTVADLSPPSRVVLRAVAMGVEVQTAVDLESTSPESCLLRLTIDLSPAGVSGRMVLAGLARLQDQAQKGLAAELRAAAPALACG